jgi:hypothetical protein
LISLKKKKKKKKKKKQIHAVQAFSKGKGVTSNKNIEKVAGFDCRRLVHQELTSPPGPLM